MSAAATTRRPDFIRNGLILGLLTALGPFAIDMYLPSLPAIGASLNADADVVLLSLTAYFITFAIGQIIFGPLSDMVGRKPPLYAGVALFLLASVGCALADDIHTLIAFRIVEGIGGAAGMVIARAIVRDLHSGHEEVRLLSLLMLVFSVSPILAPLAGSLVIEQSSWRGVFWLITGLAALGLLLAALFMPETRSREARAQTDLAGILAAFRRLLSDRDFMGLSFVGAFAVSGFFVFLASSSFVMTGEFGLSPMAYSLTFSLNAASFFTGMQLSGRLGQRYGMRTVVRASAVAYAAVMVLLFVVMLSGAHSLPLLLSALFVGYGFLGLLLPVSSVLAMEEHGAIAGTASSLMGTLHLVTGSVMMGIAGKLTDGTALPMVGGIAGCAVLTLVLSRVLLRGDAAIASA